MSMPLFLLPPVIAARIKDLTARSEAAKKELETEKQKDSPKRIDKVKEAASDVFQPRKCSQAGSA